MWHFKGRDEERVGDLEKGHEAIPPTNQCSVSVFQMTSNLGEPFRCSRLRAISAIVMATCVVVVDFLLSLHWKTHQHFYAFRNVLTAFSVVCMLILAHGDLSAIGITLRFHMGIRY